MVRGTGRKTRSTGTFGTVQELPSGRFRAMYYGPDGRRYKAPRTFTAKADARGWLALRQSEIISKSWKPPGVDELPQSRVTFKTYADTWLKHRDLKDRTREHYKKLLEDHLGPAFDSVPIAAITPDDVRAWHTQMGEKKTPTLRAHAYGLLRTIMGTAASDGKISANPCVIRGASSAKRVHKIRPASLDEIATIAEEMPEQYRAMILLAGWCALRFGELTELRRRDVTIVEPTKEEVSAAARNGKESPESYGVVRVDRAVVRTNVAMSTRVGPGRTL